MLPALKSVTNIDPRHIAEVVKAGHLPVRAFIIPMDPPPIPIPCQFNPNDIKYTSSGTWNKTKGDKKQRPDPEFSGGQEQSLEMKLHFDTSESGYVDVRLLVYPLIDLTKVDPFFKMASFTESRPRFFRFIWGMFSVIPSMAFKAYMDSITVNFTYFSPEGIPLRADADVKFTAVPENLLMQNPTSRSYSRKMRIVSEGETLDYIAYQEYGSSDHWRHIAETNNIANPFTVRSGTVLKLTPLESEARR